VHESKPVGGIPVFLYPADERTRRSANGPRITQTDAEGRYRLESLPRGVYRLLASFDLSEVSEELLESARAPSVTLKVSETATHDLSPFSAP
jgi:protocatechuate 3,4-dioxygenase beta subunit